MNVHPYHPHAIRRGLIEMIVAQSYTHALTLNTDRELSVVRMQSIFGTFCARIDRLTHNRQRVANIPPSVRLKAIALPEHLTTNAHLHVLADLSLLEDQGHDEGSLHECVRRCWLQSTHGAGSVFVERLRCDGFAHYATKEVRSTDPTYFLSSEYHPH